MGTLKIRIPDELERKFRETAMKLYGFKKGSLSVAAEKAISAWLSQVMELAEAVATQSRRYMAYFILYYLT